MKVYKVYPEHTDYDQYEAIVVVAENKARALEFAKTGDYGGSYFEKNQGQIYVKEIDLTKEQVVLNGFNAG